MYVYQGYWCIVFVVVFVSLSGFGIRIILTSQNEFDSLPFLSAYGVI
jgi:hypothetical protein